MSNITIDEIELPKSVSYVINALEEAGFEAYIVGGCVRDCILQREPADWDVTTNALPEQVMTVFQLERVIPTGIKHGTVSVIKHGQQIEITTYRIDGNYIDCRRPENVIFTRSLRDDLARRDFTINAMAYSRREGIIDYYNGQDDIAGKMIRCVGDPCKRFREDALRIIRGMRFASSLSFEIEQATQVAMYANKQLLLKIAYERINTELKGLLCGAGASKIIEKYIEIIEVFVPEFKERSERSFSKLIKCLSKTGECRPGSEEFVYRLILLVDCAANGNSLTAARILRRLKSDNDTIKSVSSAIAAGDGEIACEPIAVKQLISKFGFETAKNAIKLHYPECMNIYDSIVRENECCTIKQLDVNGKDLMELGIQGPRVGEVISSLLEDVIQNKCQNNKKILIKQVVDKYL